MKGNVDECQNLPITFLSAKKNLGYPLFPMTIKIISKTGALDIWGKILKISIQRNHSSSSFKSLYQFKRVSLG